jgi:hypothetical protein
VGTDEKHAQEERHLLGFLSAMGIPPTDFTYGRTGLNDSSPDFWLQLTKRRYPVGFELTTITTPDDERGPVASQSVADEMQEELRARADEDPTLKRKFHGRSLVVLLAGLPSDRRRRELIPEVVSWLLGTNLRIGISVRPDANHLREFIEGVELDVSKEGPPRVWAGTAGITGCPSALEAIKRKRAKSRLPTFKRLGETWLLMHGRFASLVARSSGTSGDVLREASDCIATGDFDRIFLFNPNEMDVWEFGWGRSRGL